jgi:predicted transcriptional regulator
VDIGKIVSSRAHSLSITLPPKKKTETLGRAELELLQFIEQNAPTSVGDVAKVFGVERGLARTTVQTMMERLVAKGFLDRRQVRSVFQYSPAKSATKVVANLVSDFVRGVLGGSVSPFFAYLSENQKLTAQELAELRSLVAKIDAQEEEPAPTRSSSSMRKGRRG